MNISKSHARNARFASAALLALPLLVHAQNPPPPQSTQGGQSTQTPPDPNANPPGNFPAPQKTPWFPKGPIGLKFVTIGFRIPIAIQPEIANGNTTKTVNSTTTSIFNTTGKTSRVAVGLVLEFPVYKHVTLVAEGNYHHITYQEIREDDQLVSGKTTGTNVTTSTANVKARELEFPVMLRYNGIRSHGVLSKLFIGAGETYRRLSNVTTTTKIAVQNVGVAEVDSTSYLPVTPNRRTTTGTVVGIGFKLLDGVNIRLTPEVRYTRWNGRVFDADSTRTRNSLMEVGFALTF
jgi:hypothetical protein